jgi:hypothetical protein
LPDRSVAPNRVALDQGAPSRVELGRLPGRRLLVLRLALVGEGLLNDRLVRGKLPAKLGVEVGLAVLLGDAKKVVKGLSVVGH